MYLNIGEPVLIVVKLGQVVGPLLGQDHHDNDAHEFVQGSKDVPHDVVGRGRSSSSRAILLPAAATHTAAAAAAVAPVRRRVRWLK